MTLCQFAVASGADPKWLLNSSKLLRRRLRRTPREASWWGLVRMLESSFKMPLGPAAQVATDAMKQGTEIVWLRARSDPSGSAAMVVNLQRYRSVAAANLSRALVRETPKVRGRHRQGRNPIAAAVEYGLDIGLMKSALEKSPAQRLRTLEANKAFVDEIRRRREIR